MKKAIYILCMICLMGSIQTLQADSLPPLFINPNNTITDTSTGLMWYQALSPETVTWDKAKSNCANLSVTSLTNWRLPTFEELKNLFDKMDSNSNALFFPSGPNGTYWTSSTNSDGNSLTIVTIDTEKAKALSSASESFYFRAVRDGNDESSFIQVPSSGIKYEIGSLVKITWDTDSYTRTVNLEISRDGGVEYEPIITNISKSPHNWIVSRPASPNCQLRIINKEASLSDTVGYFSVADAYAPKISSIFPRSTLPGKQSDSIEYLIDNTDGGDVMVIARSSNHEIVPPENIQLSSRLPSYTKAIPSDQVHERHYFTIQATENRGQVTITLEIYDSGLLTNQTSFDFIVGNQRDALIHLYEQTGGTGWNNNTNWNTVKHECEWEGILCDQYQQVIEINLQNNRLSGIIPVDLSNIVDLQGLNLSNNYLYDSIPENLYLLQNLKELHLENNHLSGEIPETLFWIEHMEKLYLGNNQLQGTILSQSSQITKLANIVEIDISNNQFSGIFSNSIAYLYHLVMLDISQNNFTGSIPESLSSLQLQKISIASNQFNGNMPEYFQSLNALNSNQSDFRYNMLTAPNDDVADFMSEKQIENDWSTFQTLPPTNLKAITATNNMIQFSWEPVAYTADGGYEICCFKNNGFDKCKTINNKSLSAYELWGVLPGSNYECSIRSITLPNIHNKNKLISSFSKAISVTTKDPEDIWNIMETSTHNWLNDVWGLASSKQYVVGEAGIILVSDGSEWIEMESNTTQNLNSVFGFSDNNIVAVGAEGIILQYNGNQWEPQSSVVNSFLWGIWGTDNVYYAVGAYGTIIKRINGTWESIGLSTNNDLRAIWGSSENDIFVVGQYGTIYHFNGATWSEMESNTEEDLFCVWGFSETNVFAAGINGVILRYNGASWTPMITDFDTHLMDMWGSTENSMFAVGDQGTTLFYDGSSWQNIYSGTQNYLKGIWGGSGLFAVGYNGTILRFSTQVPTISNILDQQTNVNIPIKVTFTVESTMVPPERLNVKAISANNDLIPSNQLEIFGMGSLRELHITPEQNKSGETTIVVTVTTPEGLTSSTRFSINVSSDPLIPYSEREALLLLFYQTNGYQWSMNDNWTEKWGTECNWYGITCDTDHTHIEKIDLSNNGLSGALPITLSNLTYLNDLDLHGNVLTGELPGAIGKLGKLANINLSYNQISGSLPEEWGTLAKLKFLNLEHNKLEGSIPSSIGNMEYLQSIQLNSNRFCGSIPIEITDLDLINENESNFHYNALYSTNDSVTSFMNKIQSNWNDNQTTMPESLSLTWTAYVITLNWKPDTIHSFEVFYSDDPDDNFTQIGPISGSTARIRGLFPETTCYIKIRKIRAPHAENTNTVYSDFVSLSATTAPKSDISSLWENGNFDEADFYPWDIQDLSTSRFFDVVQSKTWTEPEFEQFFHITPSDRDYVAVHAGIEGQGTVALSQVVYIPAGGGTASFDYRMGWQMSSSAIKDRTFSVSITLENDDTPSEIHTILSTSSSKEMLDTGWQTHTMDVSAYECQSIKVSFELDYPESTVSPMLFVLDNVQLNANYENILELVLPETLHEGNAIITDVGQIKLPEAVDQDTSIHLVSSNDLIMIPDQVLISKGENQVRFNIVVGDDTAILGQRDVIVSVDDPYWAACEKHIVLYDNDDTWKQIDTITTKQDLKQIWGRSENDIFVLSDSHIIHFNGNSWETQYTQTYGYLNAIWGDQEKLFVVGDEGTLLSYENNQWVPEHLQLSSSLTGIWGNEDAIFAAGDYGMLLKKTGDEWLTQSTIISGGMPVILGGYDQSIYMISESSVYEYTKGDWTPLSVPIMPLLSDIHGTSVIHPVFVGDEGNILYAHKNIWTTSQINMTTDLNGVFGKNNVLYVVGDNGTILRSDASAEGLTFYQMSSNNDNTLNDVWGSSENNVYAVGNNGTVLRYSGPDVLGFQNAGSFVPGELLSVQNVISFPANVRAITLKVQVPDQLIFKEKSDDQCEVSYKNHTLYFAWSYPLKSPILFNYVLSVPTYIGDIVTISASLTYLVDNETLNKEMTPATLILEKSIKKYTLNIDVSPEDGGNVSGDELICPQLCRKEFESAEYIQLLASPKSHFNFVKWTDNNNQTISSEEMLSFTITEDQTLHAIFRLNEAPLKPVVTYPQNWDIVGSPSIYFELMPFSDPENDPHYETEWLIHRADRPHTCKGIFAENCINDPQQYLTQYYRDDLVPGMQYVWDVANSDTGSKTLVYSDIHRFTIGRSTQNESINISPGLDQEDYQMISIPIWLENAAASVALKDALHAGYDTRYFKIGRFDPTVNQYVQYNDSMLLLPGMAFWILSRNGMEIPSNGVHVTTTEDIDIPLTYSETNQNGWNMIGSPTKMSYNWGQLIVIVYNDNFEIIAKGRTIAQLRSDNPYVNTRIWRWNNGSYEENDTKGIIEPDQGYWVEAKYPNVWLRFSVSAQVDMRKRSADQWGDISDSAPPAPMQGFQEMGDISGGCFIEVF
jgi:photosystem II stability/assembly factor-like uncharacterized protein/Leucine-rich repeat (LRR) protein